MNKIAIIIKREYLTRVAKRSFLLTTILVPLFIFGFYAILIAIAVKGGNETQRIAVIDEANLFNGKIEKKENFTFQFITNENPVTYKEKYVQQGYTSYLYVPPFDLNKPSGIIIYSESQIGPMTKGSIEKIINNAIENKRMLAANIDPARMKEFKSDISINAEVGKGKEFKKGASEVSYGVGFTAGILIYITMFIYGMMVMRGVMEEKINRISEVVISSVKPFQLMLGKIVGIAAVGITQFMIWIALMFVLQLFIPLIFPGLASQMAAQTSQNPTMQQSGMVSTIIEGLRSLNIGLILFAFIFYFIGGYLLYASLFAAVGSVVSEDQQEAQQLTLPITMPIVIAFVIMTKAVGEPNSGLALFGSLFPLTSPIVMMGRIAYEPPFWQIALSMFFLVLGFLGTTWLAAKIYRTGILLYGKKVTWRVMWKWAFRSS